MVFQQAGIGSAAGVDGPEDVPLTRAWLDVGLPEPSGDGTYLALQTVVDSAAHAVLVSTSADIAKAAVVGADYVPEKRSALIDAALKAVLAGFEASMNRMQAAVDRAVAEADQLEATLTGNPVATEAGNAALAVRGAEVRTWLLGLAPGARSEVVSNAVRDGEVETLHACLAAPVCFHLLSDREVDQAQTSCAQVADPAGLERLGVLRTGIGLATMALNRVRELVTERAHWAGRTGTGS